MNVESPSGSKPNGVVLDEAPPSPSKMSTRKRSLMDAGRGDADQAAGGEMMSSPPVRALMGMKQTEQGLQVLASVMPDVAPQLLQFLSQLQPLVAQFVTAGGAGGSPMGGALAMGAPVPPPPAMPMQGGGGPPPGMMAG